MIVALAVDRSNFSVCVNDDDALLIVMLNLFVPFSVIVFVSNVNDDALGIVGAPAQASTDIEKSPITAVSEPTKCRAESPSSLPINSNDPVVRIASGVATPLKLLQFEQVAVIDEL